MLKKILKISAIIIGIILIGIVSFFFYVGWRIDTGDLIQWDGEWYTMEQLKKKLPPQYYEAKEKNTPEQVYVKFREALLKDDIETALGLIVEKNKEEYRKDFENKEVLAKYKTIPDVSQIRKSKEDSYGNYARYSYFIEEQKTDNIPFEIDFEKNFDGYWEIEDI
ncbi:MAG: hypothetical protein ABH818_00010 [Patescibacteria group bacterium]